MMPDADIVALSGSVSNHWSQEVGRAHRHELDEHAPAGARAARAKRARQRRPAGSHSRGSSGPGRAARPRGSA